jgi:RNA polymerase sigma-70 factor (ECF subfamily)
MHNHTTFSLDETLEDDSENVNELLFTRLQQPPSSVEEQVETRQLNKLIQKGLSQLSMEYRTIITMVDIEEMSYTEAAGILNIPVGTVKSRLARARDDLRRKLFRCKFP